MNVTVSGHHVDTGEALKAHASGKIGDLQEYFDHIQSAHVVFGQEAHHQHLHRADVTVHANGIVLKAGGNGIDFYAAIDDAATKLVKQLKKYKGRLSKHRERRKKYADKMKSLKTLNVEDHALDEDALEAADDNIFTGFSPDIEKKEVGQIVPMSVDEAVMQMDLLHKPAFLFLNASSGTLNMVYRDGDAVRWVAPK
jgi:ribosomal subunit interface protein